MVERLMGYAAGFPAFLLYFALAIALLGLFITVYMWITPHRELALVREGNTAAAVSLGGSVIGFVIPLSVASSQSASVIDMAMWGLIALVVQTLVFLGVRFTVPDLAQRIVAGNVAAALWHATLAIAVGVLSAASMTS